MSRNINSSINPFSGIASATTTSAVVDLRDAVAWDFSAYTSAGTASAFTLQLSTADGNPSTVGAATFIDRWGASAATHFSGPQGVRFARVIRDVSACSWVMSISKLVR